MFASLLLAVACAPAVPDIDSVVRSDPGTVDSDTGIFNGLSANPEPTEYEVNFTGDLTRWLVVELSCVNDAGEIIDYVGVHFENVLQGQTSAWVTFENVLNCPRPHFNVWDEYGPSPESSVLGNETLNLWVFENRYEGSPSGYEEDMYLPSTIDGTPYLTGGQTPEPFEAIVGWEYEPATADPPS